LRPLPAHPCASHPCGPQSVCRAAAGRAECSCLPGTIGSAPNCRPECLLNSDCPTSRHCVNRLCVDPCAGACGVDAQCRVVNHSPVCQCRPGYQGNGYAMCKPIPVVGKDRLRSVPFQLARALTFPAYLANRTHLGCLFLCPKTISKGATPNCYPTPSAHLVSSIDSNAPFLYAILFCYYTELLLSTKRLFLHFFADAIQRCSRNSWNCYSKNRLPNLRCL